MIYMLCCFSVDIIPASFKYRLFLIFCSRPQVRLSQVTVDIEPGLKPAALPTRPPATIGKECQSGQCSEVKIHAWQCLLIFIHGDLTAGCVWWLCQWAEAFQSVCFGSCLVKIDGSRPAGQWSSSAWLDTAQLTWQVKVVWIFPKLCYSADSSLEVQGASGLSVAPLVISYFHSTCTE